MDKLDITKKRKEGIKASKEIKKMIDTGQAAIKLVETFSQKVLERKKLWAVV